MGVTIKEIDAKLHKLPEEKLEAVYQFVSCLSDQENANSVENTLLSEASLAVEWNTSEEDKAWRHLDALPSC